MRDQYSKYFIFNHVVSYCKGYYKIFIYCYHLLSFKFFSLYKVVFIEMPFISNWFLLGDHFVNNNFILLFIFLFNFAANIANKMFCDMK